MNEILPRTDKNVCRIEIAVQKSGKTTVVNQIEVEVEVHFRSSETAVIITFAVDKMVINCLKCSKLQRDSLEFPFPGACYLTFCI